MHTIFYTESAFDFKSQGESDAMSNVSTLHKVIDILALWD
jgi:hypothetical protein